MPVVLTSEEALARFAAEKAGDESFLQTFWRFLILPGPLEIEGSLGSDYLPEGETAGTFDCIVVDGDLTVSGRIRLQEPRPALLVRGNLKARTLENDYSHVLVLGDADVAQVIYGLDNDGRVTIRGNVTVPYLILEGQSFRARGEMRIGTTIEGYDSGLIEPAEFDSAALFDPDVEQALVAEVFDGKRFSMDLFLDRLDRSLPVFRSWSDLHPGYARVRAFAKIPDDEAPEEVYRAATELLQELDALAFDHPYARLRIVEMQVVVRWEVVVKRGDSSALPLWGEAAETLARLLPAAPLPRKWWNRTPMEGAALDACDILNDYGWYVFQHCQDPEELARAARVMRTTLPCCRFLEEYWYVVDTAVRLLLKTGQQEEAFPEVQRVLEKYPDFEGVQDIQRSADYQSWLQGTLPRAVLPRDEEA